MPALSLLSAVAGSPAAPDTVPDRGHISHFAICDPPSAWGLTSHMGRGFHMAGPPEIVTRNLTRPLQLGAVQSATSDFARGRYFVTLEAS